MALKRSEQYLYFQNKAHHYHNVNSAKATLSHSPQGTLQPHRNNDRDISFLDRHEIKYQNERLANRILSISTTPRKQVEVTGSYSRFNRFERGFRHKNPLKEEEERQISLENERISKHISATRARIGNNSAWQAEYKDKANYRRLRSRYDQNKSKDSLNIEVQPFLLDPYMKYLQTIAPIPPPSQSATSRPRHVRHQKEKLFLLPSFSAQRKLVP